MADPVAPTVVQLIASSGFYGGEQVVANICKTIRERPIEVVCLTRSREKTAPFQRACKQADNIRFTTIDNSLVKALSLLRSLYNQENGLIIHCHGYKETFIASLFNLLFPAKVVVTQHGFTERNRKSKLYNFINKCCCRFAKIDSVLAVSRSIYAIYEKFGVSQNRLHYLPNSLVISAAKDAAPLELAGNTFRKHHNISEDSAILLFAGRLSKEKDPLLFLQAFIELKQNQPDIHAVLAGEGPLRNALEDSIAESGLEKDVTLAGFVTDMQPLLHEAALLLLTSETEGLPLIVLEAMAAGTPVVASAVGDIPKVIKTGQNGMTVQPRSPQNFAEPCRLLLNNRQLYTNIKEKACKTIEEHYNFSHQKEFYLQLYTMEPAS